MNNITLITPPDFLYNEAINLLVICPSIETKSSLNEILLSVNEAVNLLLYETPENQLAEIEWILNSAALADIIVIDLDNCDVIVRQFASYIIAKNKTFYLTNDNTIPYNLISKNRIYDFAWLEQILNRGTNE